MKRRILALVAAATLVMGMSLSVSAASSTSSDTVASAAQSIKQEISVQDVLDFVDNTELTTTVEGAKIIEVNGPTAAAAIKQAAALYGDDVTVATIVDLIVPKGTGTATFTLACPNVWKGQSVTVLHQLSDGSWEKVTPNSVDNGSVTFTLSSYSPVAVVVDGAKAPKTGDPSMLFAMMAMASLAGVVAVNKKN